MRAATRSARTKKAVKTIAIPNPRRMPFSSSQRTAGPSVPATRSAATRTRRTGQSRISSHAEPTRRTSTAIVRGAARSARFSDPSDAQFFRALPAQAASARTVADPVSAPIGRGEPNRPGTHCRPAETCRSAGRSQPTGRRLHVACRSFLKLSPAPCSVSTMRTTGFFTLSAALLVLATGAPVAGTATHSLSPRCRPECRRPRCPGTCMCGSSSRPRHRDSTRSWSCARGRTTSAARGYWHHTGEQWSGTRAAACAAPARPLGQCQLQEGAWRHALHPGTLVERAGHSLIPDRRKERSWTQSSSSSSVLCSAAAASTGTRDAGNVVMRQS